MTLGELKKRIKQVESKLVVEEKFSLEEIEQMPVYLGDDEELNGIHKCWYFQDVGLNEPDWEDLAEQVDNDIDNKYILIS